MNISTIKERLREHQIILFFRVSFQLFFELKTLSKSLGASNTHRSKNKMEAKIKIAYHAIEKGLSLPNPRTGFGESKVMDLLKEISFYYSTFGYNDFLEAPLSTIHQYLEFNRIRCHINENLTRSFTDLLHRLEFPLASISRSSGTLHCSECELIDISSNRYLTFKELLETRHSIRTFTKREVPIDILDKGIELAGKAPSACNRQPWKVYIYKNETLKKEILNFQGGNKGFGDEIDTAILITSDLNQYFIGEIHQAYVDGALFAMTLIYAYHSLNVGTIPLTNGLKSKEIFRMKKKFNIPSNEVPIMMLGLGYMKDKFEVAASQRYDINFFTKYFL